MTNKHLSQLYKNKQFLQLDKENTDQNSSFYHFYKAVFANVSNKPQLSNDYLDQFVAAVPSIPAQIASDYWKLSNDNYVKLFDYANAYQTNNKLITNSRSKWTDKELENAQTTLKIWKSLVDIAPQSINDFISAEIPIHYDIANLINLPVSVNNITTPFVFDTGAGISSINESLAKKLGLEFIESEEKIGVKGFTGIANPIQLAIAKELRIAHILVKNALFLVFKDEALTFSGGAYVINGIIGFPIAKELGTISITKNKMVVTKNQAAPDQIIPNLFIELLHPIVYFNYKGKTLPFTFDTGAVFTVFSKAFFEEFGAELQDKGTVQKRTSASAGGSHTATTLNVEHFELQLNKQVLHFPKLAIDMDNYQISGKEFYGNIGQDLFGQYALMTISFEHNYLALEA